ncbi:MAG: hypothetical protein ACREAN_07195, partial [Nitrosopumilaceae archaeon]
IKIIDLELHLPFVGLETEKDEILSSNLFSSAIRQAVKEVSAPKLSRGENVKKQSWEKQDQHITNVYPLFDASLVTRLLKHQVDRGSEFISGVYVPITADRVFERQVQKAEELLSISKQIYERVFPKIAKERDFVNTICINLSVLNSENHIQRLIDLALANNPDQIAIRALNLSRDGLIHVRHFLDFIKALRDTVDGRQEGRPIEQRTPIHILNVREEGYLTFCYGANTVTSPLARPTFLHINHSRKDPRDAGKGAFYHPIDMSDDSPATCMEKSFPMEYQIPCGFNPCRTYGKFNNPSLADEYVYNDWRKEHFIHTKSDESRQIKETDQPLNMALRDKFARSWQAIWLPFLEVTPTLAFRIGVPES